MTLLFIEYPKCSTCQKAKRWLIEHNIPFTDRHIVENPPSAEELKNWASSSDIALSKFFNTSGLLYRSMNLKDKLPLLSDDEKLQLLSSNGMLVKRPLLVGTQFLLIGFNEKIWLQTILP